MLPEDNDNYNIYKWSAHENKTDLSGNRYQNQGLNFAI